MADLLVVDDDRDIRTILAFALEDAGHAIREAADGTAAIVAMEKRAPDCVVLDLLMPKLDGFGVLRGKRKAGLAPDARVLVLTAKTAERDHVRGWELGADEYLTKPFDPDEVVAKVEALLRATPAELQERREQELRRAELLERLELAFNRPRPVPRP